MALSRIEIEEGGSVFAGLNLISNEAPEIIHPTETRLRRAVHAHESAGGRKAFDTFPFGVTTEGTSLLAHFRKGVLGGHEVISIDLGNFQYDGSFRSQAFVDIIIGTSVPPYDSEKDRLQMGIVCVEHPKAIEIPRDVLVRRPVSKVTENCGIYVNSILRTKKDSDRQLKSNGIGRSLITAARVVLDEEGVRYLVADKILCMDAGTPTGQFYRRLGGHIFGKDKETGEIHDQKGKFAIPTRSIMSAPYVFI